MPVYIAMLRGINLGPHKRMKMEKLRSSCAALGFAEVKTYIQSGNIVFCARKAGPETLAKKLELQIVRDFGFSADVILRTQQELEQVVSGNPLLREPAIDDAKLHVVCARQAPSHESLAKLESLVQAPDRVRHARKEIYFYFPNGVSGSSLWKHPLDRILQVPGTMRNWRTVNTLCEMAAECR
jgi:uncharacterized protein (DUF1697 family)